MARMKKRRIGPFRDAARAMWEEGAKCAGRNSAAELLAFDAGWEAAVTAKKRGLLDTASPGDAGKRLPGHILQDLLQTTRDPLIRKLTNQLLDSMLSETRLKIELAHVRKAWKNAWENNIKERNRSAHR